MLTFFITNKPEILLFPLAEVVFNKDEIPNRERVNILRSVTELSNIIEHQDLEEWCVLLAYRIEGEELLLLKEIINNNRPVFIYELYSSEISGGKSEEYLFSDLESSSTYLNIVFGKFYLDFFQNSKKDKIKYILFLWAVLQGGNNLLDMFFPKVSSSSVLRIVNIDLNEEDVLQFIDILKIVLEEIKNKLPDINTQREYVRQKLDIKKLGIKCSHKESENFSEKLRANNIGIDSMIDFDLKFNEWFKKEYSGSIQRIENNVKLFRERSLFDSIVSKEIVSINDTTETELHNLIEKAEEDLFSALSEITKSQDDILNKKNQITENINKVYKNLKSRLRSKIVFGLLFTILLLFYGQVVGVWLLNGNGESLFFETLKIPLIWTGIFLGFLLVPIIMRILNEKKLKLLLYKINSDIDILEGNTTADKKASFVKRCDDINTFLQKNTDFNNSKLSLKNYMEVLNDEFIRREKNNYYIKEINLLLDILNNSEFISEVFQSSAGNLDYSILSSLIESIDYTKPLEYSILANPIALCSEIDTIKEHELVLVENQESGQSYKVGEVENNKLFGIKEIKYKREMI